MECPSCRSPMKPLFTGFYCPRDCDRSPSGPASGRTPIAIFNWGGRVWYAYLEDVPRGDQGWSTYTDGRGHLSYDDFVRDPVEFGRNHWRSAAVPGWTAVSHVSAAPQPAVYRLLHLVPA